MNLGELLSGLSNRPPTAQVLVIETDFTVGPGEVFTIESVMKEGSENVVMPTGKSVTRWPLDEAMGRMIEKLERGEPTRVFKASIQKSGTNDGKYQVAVDGRVLQSDFETEHEARIFVNGFVMGPNWDRAGRDSIPPTCPAHRVWRLGTLRWCGNEVRRPALEWRPMVAGISPIDSEGAICSRAEPIPNSPSASPFRLSGDCCIVRG
jgi:hypothetical protein